LHGRAADDDAAHCAQLAESLRKLRARILDLRCNTTQREKSKMSTQLQMVTRYSKAQQCVKLCVVALQEGAADDDAFLTCGTGQCSR
jgi:hypothetical protein